ncbi:FAD-binding oxidoreductase [uncultured Thiothrix sp.]|uniref:NAD(P)/FAD-dependent oxidoreductase n=1 Tax=uncultured Thiothrix sp. TaxID=223185 RepID=UPI00262AC6A3|nr:FAD-dependent oxidoreductase [uncultured Thiothrix sp.]
MSKQYDAIIIGAGIIGAAIGLELARRGWKTLNVDKLGAAGFGSTSNSSAIIRTYYSTLDGTAMAYEGYHYWRDWAKYVGVEDESGLAQFNECGCLVMKVEHNGYLEKAIQLSKELGIPYREVSPEELQEFIPGYDARLYYPPKRPDQDGFAEPTTGALRGAVHWPKGGYVNDPQLAAHNLQRAAEAAGGAFRFNAEVVEIRQANGRVCGISLKNGEQIDSPVVVNVGGPHSSKINALVGLADKMKMSTRALRQEIPHVPPPPHYDYIKLGMVTSDSDVAVYSRPASGGMMLLGSEDPECDPKEWVDPDTMSRDLTEHAVTHIMRMAQRYPDLGIPNQVRGTVEAYDVTEDWIPIYDKTDLPGYYIAIGTSGNQFKNTAVAGKMMATLIVACEAGQDHDKDPVQYTMEYLGRTLSIGFYSRNREINQESSFSVLG